MPNCKVLLVDDEPAWLRSMELLLSRQWEDVEITSCSDSRSVLEIIEKEEINLVLLDLVMPCISGENLLLMLRKNYPDVLVIIVTGMDTANKAVECLNNGAFDYFVKTWGEKRLLAAMGRALRVVSLEKTAHRVGRNILNQRLTKPEAFSEIITANSKMFAIFAYMETVLPSAYPVLITGESGTGKELLARAAARLVAADKPFIWANMASLEGDILEDTLFGHVRGAYTNAAKLRPGLVEKANGGVLFLDEIGDLSLQAQGRLLRFLQDGEYYPIGSDKPKKLKAQLLLATNRDIANPQCEPVFRRDLYYRICAHQVEIPPLRLRKEDIPLLCSAFLREICQEYGCAVPELGNDALLRFLQYSWPGNIRELKALLVHAASLGKSRLEASDFDRLPADAANTLNENAQESQILQFFLDLETLPSFCTIKKIMTTAAMLKSGGNQTAAAKILGISQPAISKRLNS